MGNKMPENDFGKQNDGRQGSKVPGPQRDSGGGVAANALALGSRD